MMQVIVASALTVAIAEAAVYFEKSYDKSVIYIPLSEIPLNVNEIVMRNNRITNLPSSVFGGFSELLSLDMQKNKITSVSPSAFAGTPLERLRLSENLLTCIPDLSSVNQTIKVVSLQNNQIGDCMEGAEDVDFNNVQNLLLGNNRLTKVTAMVFRCPSLSKLWLRANPIREVANLTRYNHRLTLLTFQHADLQCGCQDLWIKQVNTAFVGKYVPLVSLVTALNSDIE